MRPPKLALVGLPVLALVLVGSALGAVRLRGRDAATPSPTAANGLYQDAAGRRTSTDTEIETLQSRLTKGKQDPLRLAQLGGAYLQKVRETGNPTYYGKAETVFKRSLALAPENEAALTGMGALALSRHQFREALEWGERAVQANPYRAANYGILGDAQIELGRYDDAVATIQKMVDTRPDLSSYSRVSYVRELYGRVDGAIEAMQRAVAAGSPAVENTNYVRVQLGNLYFNSGRLDEAERQYRTALQRAPDYGLAQAGMAYVRAARGDDAGAIELLTKAVESMPLPEHVIALGDLYARNGRTDEARRQYELVRVLERLFTANGVALDAETALFLADHDLPEALTYARAGYEQRPSIYGADVLGWSLYKAGRYQEAQTYAQEALRLGTKDALKLYHAGMIALALNQPEEARRYLEQALGINPNFSILYAATARDTLTALGGTAPAVAAARSVE